MGQNNRAGRTQRRNQARADRRITNRATSNVELQDAGQANQLQSQLQQAQEDYLRSTQAAQSIWPGAQEAMAGVERPQFGRIGNEFDTALGTVANLFGGGQAAPYMAPGEGAAGMGLGQAYGEAGHTMLANAAEREGMFRTSAERQAGLEGQYAQDNLLQRMQDTVQGYNDQMRQLRADDPWQIQNESQRLWEQQKQDQALASKLKSDKAFSEWLQGQAGALAAGGAPHNGRPDIHNPATGNAPSGPGNDQVGSNPVTGFGGTGGLITNPVGQTGPSSQPPGYIARSHEINQLGSFEQLPPWLQNLYQNASGHDRWALVENDPRRAQIFRRTRPHVQSLWAGQQTQNEGYPQGYPGRQIVSPR